MAVQITRTEFSPAALRHMARVASDPDQASRLLAIASVLEGASRTDAAKSAGMERQTLRDWVHRFNAEGVVGLKDRARPGRKPLLGEEQLLELDQVLDTQPDPVEDGVVRWRCCDLKVQIKNRFDVEISERSVERISRERKFRRLSPRPKHAKADEALAANFKDNFADAFWKALPEHAKAKPIEIWFQMEQESGNEAR